jgi:hypothetical protein
MLVPAHNNLAPSGKNTSQEPVVVGVITDGSAYPRSRTILSFTATNSIRGGRMDIWKLLRKRRPHSLVLGKDVSREDDLQPAIAPCMQDLIGRSGEKNARDNHVRVENDLE